jgi:DNA polymerase V
MFALVDCNNFYVSCERVFRPEFNGKPVVVLSNNDGCIVARSNEVKDLGIKMGTPVFKIRDQLAAMNCNIFSSNYTLYGDMSNRVMQTLAYFSEDIEYYSIDEAFMEFPDYTEEELLELGREIVERVKQHTGMPVSVGFGPTKTLAKLANQFAKDDARKDNIHKSSYAITDEINAIGPKSMDVGEIWGIGFKYSKYLKAMGVHTVDDYCNLDKSFVKTKFTISGLTTQSELNFRKILGLDMHPEPQKNMISSRSFGKPVTNKIAMQEAVAYHVANATRKLRKRGITASILRVFIMTNRFKEGENFWSASVVLDSSTNNTIEVMKKAMAILDRIYLPNKEYKKAGVMLLELSTEDLVFQNLFDKPQPLKITQMFKAVDYLNTIYGKNKIKLTRQGVESKKSKEWMMIINHSSPRYTTSFDEIMVIKN